MKSNYWTGEGTHVCRVVDCESGQYDNAAKDRCLRFVLEDADKRICRINFVVTEKSMAAIRSFAAACGVKMSKCQLPSANEILGRDVEIDVVINDQGYPLAQRWRRPTPPEKRASGEEDETLF